MNKAFFCLALLPITVFASATYTVSFNVPYPASGPVNVPAFTEISESTISDTETSAPIEMQAYSTLPQGVQPVGISLSFEPEIHDGGIAYMVLPPYPPSAPTEPQDVRIPYTVKYKSCYSPLLGVPAPSYQTLSTTTPLQLAWQYGSNYACLSSAGAQGTHGELTITRDSLSTMPLEGDYSGSFILRVSAE